MNHAILIMTHKNAGHVYRLAQYFDQCCQVFIHFDKKYLLTDEERESLYNLPQVKLVLQEYEVNWGGTSVLDAELHLMEQALKNCDADYFHLISGQDYPVRPLQQFLDFFEENQGKEFLQYLHLPHPRWEGNTFHRLQYYYPYDLAADKKNPRQWVREQVQKQMERGVKRAIPDEFDHLYGSSQWFSITRKAMETLLNHTKESPSLYQRMWMTFAPEECYVATVLVNLMDKENIMPTNLRFIRWKYENGNRPANLGTEHFLNLIEHECFFARKFEENVSTDLLDIIDCYLLKDHPIQEMKSGGWNYDGVLAYGYDNSFYNYVVEFCCDTCITSAIDMGCGAGIYVALWRRRQLPFAGYDGNPHTPTLSKLLLPADDTACGVADITADMESADTFELVVCKDVLPFIPKEKESKAIGNLARLSSHFILISWSCDGYANYKNIPCPREMDKKDILSLFEHSGFVVEHFMTAKFRVIANKQHGYLLIKKGTQLISNI